MSSRLYLKLALKNINDNKRLFTPYILMSSVIIAMFYLILSLQFQLSNAKVFGAAQLSMVLSIGMIISALMCFIIILYINGFLIKQRMKELGLYSILGLEKPQIIKLVSMETLVVCIESLFMGLFAGLMFSKLAFLVIRKLIRLSDELQFHLYFAPFIITALFFLMIFAITIFKNSIKLTRLDTLEILREQAKGEKPAKFNVLSTILGLALTLGGYYISLTTKNPVDSMGKFTVAVVLVILGTYLLFNSFSIALLKFMQGRKKFYYKSSNMISISTMMYRMRQNAAGLASICILSTMMLVSVSTTISLFGNMESLIKNRFSLEVINEFKDINKLEKEKYIEESFALAKEKNVKIKDICNYNYSANTAILENNTYDISKNIFFNSNSNSYILVFMSLEDFNRIQNSNMQLAKNEVLLFHNYGNLSNVSLKYGDSIMNFNVVDSSNISISPSIKNLNFMIANNSIIVFSDIDTFSKLIPKQDISYYLGYNLEGSNENKLSFCNRLNLGASTYENAISTRGDFFALYGSLFFVGMYLGIIFLMSTVLIIYYKQVTEGIQDRNRFEILKKVGLEDKELKSIINKQVLTVFFLPIITAFIHLAVAFDNIQKIMILMNLNDKILVAKSCVIVCLVYFIVYLLIYKITAKSYYKIVNA